MPASQGTTKEGPSPGLKSEGFMRGKGTPSPPPDSTKFQSQPAEGSLEEKTKRVDLGLIETGD